MRPEQSPESAPHPVDRTRALDHVRLAIRRDWAGDVPGFETWYRVEVDFSPLVLYDLNGSELFYEFSLMLGKELVGSAKASASRILGAPVVAIEVGPRRWDPARATREARQRTVKEFRRAKVTATSFVCFSYPKIRVRVDFTAPGLGSRSVAVVSRVVMHETRLGEIDLSALTKRKFFPSPAAWEGDRHGKQHP